MHKLRLKRDRGGKIDLVAIAIAAVLSLGGCNVQPERVEPTGATHSGSQLSESGQPAEEAAGATNGDQSEDTSPAATSAPAATSSSAQSSLPIKTRMLAVKPPAFEVVPAEAKSAAATIKALPLPLTVQSYSGDELFAVGGGGCGMSLWRAEGNYSDSLVLFNGMGEDSRLLMKLDGRLMPFERIEGEGDQFYGQFAQQRFRNLAGTIEVTTAVEWGDVGEIESVAIAQGRVVVTRDGVSQEIAVKGDAGC